MSLFKSKIKEIEKNLTQLEEDLSKKRSIMAMMILSIEE